MSERIFACLLALFPSRLRKEHGAEMLQLYRDRLVEETGLIRRLHLYFDLLFDLVFGLPQAYRNSLASSHAPAVVPNMGGVPIFGVVEKEPLRRGTILAAGSINVVLIAFFAFVGAHPIVNGAFSSGTGPRSPIQSVMEKLNQPTIPDTGSSSGGDENATLSKGTTAGNAATLSSNAGSGSTNVASTRQSLSTRASAVRGTPQSAPASLLQVPQMPMVDASQIPASVPYSTVAKNATNRSSIQSGASSAGSGQTQSESSGAPTKSSTQSRSQHPSAMASANLDAAERDRVIRSVADNLVAHYYDRELAQQASVELLASQQHGYYSEIVDGQALASRLTFAVQRSTKDRHLRVEFSGNILLNSPSQPAAAVPAGYRAAMQQENCTFEKVKVLPGNIGYIKLNSFPDPGVCAATAQAAVATIRNSDAIIFDLRDNTGGFPEMVAKMAGPLFDRPVRWYNPREGDGSHWLSPSTGATLANKPVYILTSAITLSGAEQFTYNLKMLGRATVVGDTTGGSAHVGVFHRIDGYFGIGIPETRIINPYGKPDWEGTGVEPDFKTGPANALTVAEKLARNRERK